MAKEKALNKMSTDELIAVVESLQEENKQAADIISDMSAQIEKLSNRPAKQATVTVDENEYYIMIKSLNLNGKLVTSEDIQTDSALAKELIEMGSGALQLIEK